MAVVALLAAVAGAGLWWYQERAGTPPPAPADRALLSYPTPRTVADFELTDHRQEQVGLQTFRGRWSLLFFGFTHCPDVCPDTLYRLQQTLERLPEAAQKNLAIYFVSVDPERDSPERMAEYLARFSDRFTGLTGDHAQLLPFSRQLGIAYHVGAHEPGELEYAVEHSAGIVLLNPEAELHGIFTAPHDPDRMARDLTLLLSSGGDA